MITPKLLERLPHQTLVNRATLARFMSKAAGDFRDRGAAVAIFPNHGRRSVQAVRLMSLLVIDQQFICELAHDQFCFACLWKILHLLHSFKVWTTARCDSFLLHVHSERSARSHSRRCPDSAADSRSIQRAQTLCCTQPERMHLPGLHPALPDSFHRCRSR